MPNSFYLDLVTWIMAALFIVHRQKYGTKLGSLCYIIKQFFYSIRYAVPHRHFNVGLVLQRQYYWFLINNFIIVSRHNNTFIQTILSKYFFCNITARTHKLACRFFCHLHFAASTKRTGWGWGLTSSVHVKNLAKQLCRSSNSTRGSWISKGGSDCVIR